MRGGFVAADEEAQELMEAAGGDAETLDHWWRGARRANRSRGSPARDFPG